MKWLFKTHLKKKGGPKERVNYNVKARHKLHLKTLKGS